MTQEAHGFRPMHDAHAIEQVVAIVHFEAPQPDESMRMALDALDSFAKELPGAQDIRGMGFQIGPAGVIPMVSSSAGVPDGRFRFITDDRGAPLSEVRVERQGVTFRTQAYTRWELVWKEALKYLTGILPVMRFNVQSVALQYVDKFVWLGAPNTCTPNALLREGSPFVAPRTLEAADLWHCYSGQFRQASPQVRQLEVVNIDCVDEFLNGPPQRAVRISTTLTDFLNQPGFEPLAVSGSEAVNFASDRFAELHREQKRIFSEVISNELAEKVGLYADVAK